MGVLVACGFKSQDFSSFILTYYLLKLFGPFSLAMCTNVAMNKNIRHFINKHTENPSTKELKKPVRDQFFCRYSLGDRLVSTYDPYVQCML